MSRKIRIGVIDDHPLLLDGILHALRTTPDYEIIGTGETKAAAIAMAETLRPEIMLLDVGIAGGGIEAAHHIAKVYSDVKLIMFTASDRPDHVNAALAAGVMGYVLKGATSRELCESIRIVCGGKRYITPELALTMLSPHPSSIARPSGDSGVPKLSKRDFTSREIDVIQLLSAGKTNKVIAQELTLSEKTVKHHMSNIMEKLQVHSRLSAALILSKWDQKFSND
jgi:two-component system, NarL family, nitrate/nitrite response regulator NarL